MTGSEYMLEVDGIGLYEDEEILDASLVAGKEVTISLKSDSSKYAAEKMEGLQENSETSEEGIYLCLFFLV